MSDKVDWEVVDSEPGSTDNGQHRQALRTPQDVLKAMLGPWWRWKLAGLFTVGAVILLFLAAVAGVVVVTGIAFALLAFVVMRVRRWLHGGTRLPDRYR